MRGVWVVVWLALCAFALPSAAKATTFNLPLNGIIEILGDLPSPVTVTFNLSVIPIPPVPPPNNDTHPGFAYGVTIEQSAQLSGGYFFPQTCIGTECGTFAGFGGCGLQIGCGFQLPVGFVMSRGDGTNPPVPITVDDTYRFFGISGGAFSSGGVLLDVQFTLDVPDGLRAGILAGSFDVIAQTPLPATLPLFATGLGALGLLGWRRKRRAQAAV